MVNMQLFDKWVEVKLTKNVYKIIFQIFTMILSQKLSASL